MGFPAGESVITHRGSGTKSIRKHEVERLSRGILSADGQCFQKRQLSVCGNMDWNFHYSKVTSHGFAISLYLGRRRLPLLNVVSEETNHSLRCAVSD